MPRCGGLRCSYDVCTRDLTFPSNPGAATPKKVAGVIKVVGGRDALAIEVRLSRITSWRSLGVESTLYYS